jgi:hypothetical protein
MEATLPWVFPDSLTRSELFFSKPWLSLWLPTCVQIPSFLYFKYTPILPSSAHLYQPRTVILHLDDCSDLLTVLFLFMPHGDHFSMKPLDKAHSLSLDPTWWALPSFQLTSPSAHALATWNFSKVSWSHCGLSLRTFL